MVCPRCNGFMLQEVFVDFDGTDGSFEGWRCLVCGEIVDPVIASNRVLLSPGVPSYFCETPSCVIDDAQGGLPTRLRMRTLTVKR